MPVQNKSGHLSKARGKLFLFKLDDEGVHIVSQSKSKSMRLDEIYSKILRYSPNENFINVISNQEEFTNDKSTYFGTY